jgi:hypothetical protein
LLSIIRLDAEGETSMNCNPIVESIARRLTSRMCRLVLLFWLGTITVEASEPGSLLKEGQDAFQTGAFSQAAVAWQKAADAFHARTNIEGEVSASINLAGAFQALGHHRRAVQVLERTRSMVEAAGNRSRVVLVKSRLGAALTMTQEPERAASLLKESLEALKVERNPRL